MEQIRISIIVRQSLIAEYLLQRKSANSAFCEIVFDEVGGGVDLIHEIHQLEKRFPTVHFRLMRSMATSTSQKAYDAIDGI